MNYLEEYYNSYDEEGRLLSKHGQVEYLTTMKYIKESLERINEPLLLEIGAGTGRYSVTLAKEGFDVTAVELIRHNLEILNGKLDGSEKIKTYQGNALNLSFLPDNTYDLTLLLGPMYHLYTKQDKIKALSEAIRVTRPGGRVFVAYCMNEPTLVPYVFGLDHLHEVLDNNMVTDDWHCKSEPKDLFELVRIEDIEELDDSFPVERFKLVATDGATNYMRDRIDTMDDETFSKWIEYHFSICERQDLIGASHHTLDIIKKKR
jgi:ubiquinone/menaquinone biosynthesis C-methylase UbiE